MAKNIKLELSTTKISAFKTIINTNTVKKLRFMSCYSCYTLLKSYDRFHFSPAQQYQRVITKRKQTVQRGTTCSFLMKTFPCTIGIIEYFANRT